MLRKILLIINILVFSTFEQVQIFAETKKHKQREKHSEIEREDYKVKYDTHSLSRISNGDIVIGNTNSKVIVIEYFSPTCAYCLYYHQKIFPKIKEKYINTNKIAYVIREFIGNKLDLEASILARCSGSTNTYLKFLEVILKQQYIWTCSKNYREMLMNIGILGGISQENFLSCLNDQDKINILLENTKLVSNFPKFLGTPSFFINGKELKELDEVDEKSLLKTLSEVIEKQLTIDN